jgi:hypothetical protein
MTTFKIIALCFLAGCISGVVTVLLGCYTGYLVWSALGIVLFILLLLLALFVSSRFGWIAINVSQKKLLIASMFIVAIYPVSLIAMLLITWWRLYFTYGTDSLAFNRFSYSTLFRVPINQIFDERSIMLQGLTLAVFLGAMLVALSLRVITSKLDRKVLMLMLLAILATPFLNQIIAFALIREGRELAAYLPSLFSSQLASISLSNSLSVFESVYPEPELFCRNDVLLQIFPLGNGFIAALSGYWLQRANNPGQRT